MQKLHPNLKIICIGFAWQQWSNKGPKLSSKNASKQTAWDSPCWTSIGIGLSYRNCCSIYHLSSTRGIASCSEGSPSQTCSKVWTWRCRSAQAHTPSLAQCVAASMFPCFPFPWFLACEVMTKWSAVAKEVYLDMALGIHVDTHRRQLHLFWFLLHEMGPIKN